MNSIVLLLLFPLIAAILVYVTTSDRVRNHIVRVCSLITAILTLVAGVTFFQKGLILSVPFQEEVDGFMLVVEVAFAAYIIYLGIRYRKYLVCIFALIQSSLLIWFDLTQKKKITIKSDLILDKLSIIMVLIVGLIGSLISLYAVGYMKDYHLHHSEVKNRKNFFFSVIFLFLSAMFGLVMFNSLIWIYFCWEITTFCSFLLIGYTKSEEAVRNSFRALTMNLGGGVAFAVAIVIIGVRYDMVELSGLIVMKPTAFILIPVFLLSIAALTKSAQFPFSSWLLGAMVAPTPSSALLHSATMVKAGVYLIIRLAPLLGDSSIGKIVTLIGGITFLAASLIAIAQNDAKKILAYSTIANLGLIVMCASIGTQESLWAAILLVIFHSISKSLLFLSVGSIEHQLGSRNVEDMDILMKVSRKLSLYMMIGIAGMFLAPFGMLISKWVAMKAFIDSNNITIVVILVYGSAATVFYWTKWLGKLVSNANRKKQGKHIFHKDEEIPIFIQAVLVILSCIGFPVISQYALVPYLSELFGKKTLIPIQTSDLNIMLIMLSMLIILPLSFISIYKNDRRRIVPIYMAGENTGTNEAFHGAAGIDQKVEFRNWYLVKYFGSRNITFWSNITAITILCVGIVLLIRGFAI